MYVHIYIFVHLRVYVFIYTCTYIYIYIYMYINVCIYQLARALEEKEQVSLDLRNDLGLMKLEVGRVREVCVCMCECVFLCVSRLKISGS